MKVPMSKRTGMDLNGDGSNWVYESGDNTIDSFLRGYCIATGIMLDGDVFGLAFSGYELFTELQAIAIIEQSLVTYPGLRLTDDTHITIRDFNTNAVDWSGSWAAFCIDNDPETISEVRYGIICGNTDGVGQYVMGGGAAAAYRIQATIPH